MNQLPEGFKDALTTVNRTYFSFWDRLKVLIGYTLEVETKTYLEFEINKRIQEKTGTLFFRPHWFPRRKPMGGYAETTDAKT